MKSFNVTIASGKGGTGKTSLAVFLYDFLFKRYEKKVLLVDCDVEEPNLKLFSEDWVMEDEVEFTQAIPEIDLSKCNFCRKCVEYCEFNALLVLPNLKFAEAYPDLCHACGACQYICEENAIKTIPHSIGKMTNYVNKDHQMLREGRLRIGSSMQTQVIRNLKQNVKELDFPIQVFDAPPGSSCAVVESLADSDYVILVSEPTPFGLYDLKLAIAVAQEMNLDFGVVINKSDIGNQELKDHLIAEDIAIIGEIPFSRSMASAYANGNVLNCQDDLVIEAYQKIGSIVLEKILS